MNSDKIQEFEHGLAAAYRTLIYDKHRHGAQGGEKQEEEEEEEEEEEVVVHLPHVLLKILSYLPLADLYRMSGISRVWKELILDDDRIWDAMPPDAEARKSSPWMLVVDTRNYFNIVNIHTNKPEIQMCGAPYTYKISIEEPPPERRKRPNIGPSFTRGYGLSMSRNGVIFSPDVSVYCSVNPSPRGTTTPRTSEYRENIVSHFVYPKPRLHKSYWTWDHMRFMMEILHVESRACDCVGDKHSMSRTLMPLFPEIPSSVHEHSILMASRRLHIQSIKKMVQEDSRRDFLRYYHEELVASCNGLLCFLLNRYRVLVVNPLTGAFRMLPDPKEVLQGSHDMRGLRVTMSSTSTGSSGYLVIVHSGTIGPILVYNSESNAWMLYKSYDTITTTSLRPFQCECDVLFKANDTLKRLSGFDAEAGVAYELDPQAMPSALHREETSNFYSFVYRIDAVSQPWSRFFVHEGRIIYVAPLLFESQQRGYVVCITYRKSPPIVLEGFGVWELKEDSHENIMFVELSRTPRELWQRVKLLQHVPSVRTIFVHNFAFAKGSICCTIMSYLLELRLPYDDNIPASPVFPLRSTIPPLVYDLATDSWSSLPLSTTSVGLCGIEPSPWAKV